MHARVLGGRSWGRREGKYGPEKQKILDITRWRRSHMNERQECKLCRLHLQHVPSGIFQKPSWISRAEIEIKQRHSPSPTIPTREETASSTKTRNNWHHGYPRRSYQYIEWRYRSRGCLRRHCIATGLSWSHGRGPFNSACISRTVSCKVWFSPLSAEVCHRGINKCRRARSTYAKRSSERVAVASCSRSFVEESRGNFKCAVSGGPLSP